MSSIIDACRDVLPPELDEDMLDYIVSILEDEDMQSDADGTIETVAGLLASCVESEEEASDMATLLLKTLDRDAEEEEAPVKHLPVVIKKLDNAEVPKVDGALLAARAAAALSLHEEQEYIRPPRALSQEEQDKLAIKTAAKEARQAKKKNKGSGKKSSKQSLSEQAAAQAAEIDQELYEARVAAVRARAKVGAYKGALDASAFTLPNPGGGAPLLEDAACTLNWGRRYGLIGRNGMGKSTLLRAFAARRVGNIPENVIVHYVSQEVNLTDEQRLKSPVELVVDADIERRLLLDELTSLEIQIASTDGLDANGSKRHGIVLSRLDDIDSDSAERRATTLLENLGFSPELRARPLSQLSGGWRVRTMLAAAVFCKPDLLLLDEPTNHLSILAVLWLARELSESDVWKERMVVIVSHDRHFMDEVCTDCLHISGTAKRLTQCRGNYSKWTKQRKEQQVLFAKEQAHRQEEIDKLREYAGHGFKYGGSASQINKMGMKAKQADKLEEINAEHATELAALQEDVELPMNIASGGELDGFLVQLRDVAFGYPNATPARLFEHCEFGITSKSRIVLLGENGNGKTTLVKLIMGELKPTEGDVRRSPHARYAIVNQHHADQIDLSMTPLKFFLQKFPGDGSNEHMQKLRGHLASCGVTSGGSSKTVMDLQNTPASALSGGQRSRVALAAVSYTRPHVLVLDEPTNNLDLESVAALAESAQKFQGAVICVSHDQFFVKAVANEAWVVSGGKVKQVESFDVYRKRQLKVLEKQGSR